MGLNKYNQGCSLISFLLSSLVDSSLIPNCTHTGNIAQSAVGELSQPPHGAAFPRTLGSYQARSV